MVGVDVFVGVGEIVGVFVRVGVYTTAGAVGKSPVTDTLLTMVRASELVICIGGMIPTREW